MISTSENSRAPVDSRLARRGDSTPFSVKMFPVRVSVETVRPAHCLTCSHEGQPLLDTYAIVSGHTLLNQLVDTVLSTLGHPHLAVNSRGFVQVNNWKSLPFESITDNLEDTVETLFKDISGHLTLRILTKPEADSHSTQCLSELKSRLLKNAVSRQPDLVSAVDNKTIKDIIKQVVDGNDPTALTLEQISTINEWLDAMDNGVSDRRSPTGQARFNQLFEMPKLERWFKTDPSPNRQKLLQYMNQLNAGSCRQNQPKISYHQHAVPDIRCREPRSPGPGNVLPSFQLCNWFANQRSTSRASSGSSINGGTTTPISLSASSTVSSIVPKTELPVSMGADYRPIKFDFAALFESCTKKMSESAAEIRMDGGSDSPVPADDQSIHSPDNSTPFNGFDSIMIKQESSASSPDLVMSMGPTIAASPRLDLSNGANGSRSRLMFDPLTELPVLEKWFEENPHPTWMQIDDYTNQLNSREYRDNYPHISTHNVKIWFKNRRAKCKRLQTGINEKLQLFAAAAFT
ncbi:dve-1 [Pristionchus pacificus]|uniref:Dve-1 n=1 Tax=Pristionchus pacificus TaxID=54126 RepID=A0A2A6B4F0_PRIPA|nr:dve-1 [Pristionchus pacificus]|eukprot:PDM60738.1 dve-1 [Pristionchus pacificus]